MLAFKIDDLGSTPRALVVNGGNGRLQVILCPAPHINKCNFKTSFKKCKESSYKRATHVHTMHIWPIVLASSPHTEDFHCQGLSLPKEKNG